MHSLNRRVSLKRLHVNLQRVLMVIFNLKKVTVTLLSVLAATVKLPVFLWPLESILDQLLVFTTTPKKYWGKSAVK